MGYQKVLWIMLLMLGINGCALLGGSSSKKSNNNINLPKVTTIVPPGGNNSNWRYLGISDDGQIITEINDSSIVANKSQIYNYQDRKTIVNPDKFSAYNIDQPHYKYLLSNWQLSCSNKEYLILTSTLYDATAVEQLKYDYSKNDSVKWIKIGAGSLAELQYNYICLNQKRNIGY